MSDLNKKEKRLADTVIKNVVKAKKDGLEPEAIIACLAVILATTITNAPDSLKACVINNLMDDFEINIDNLIEERAGQ